MEILRRPCSPQKFIARCTCTQYQPNWIRRLSENIFRRFFLNETFFFFNTTKNKYLFGQILTSHTRPISNISKFKRINVKAATTNCTKMTLDADMELNPLFRMCRWAQRGFSSKTLLSMKRIKVLRKFNRKLNELYPIINRIKWNDSA